MKLYKSLIRDPSNKHRTKWAYFVKGKFGKKSGVFRISKSYYFDLKYNRL